ncbi:MAG: hypothetical protein HC767_12615 [Akkermansiaceae bacterium]|nr:hypothetical protein [Akkermansiaceae bacterium]
MAKLHCQFAGELGNCFAKLLHGSCFRIGDCLLLCTFVGKPFQLRLNEFGRPVLSKQR